MALTITTHADLNALSEAVKDAASKTSAYAAFEEYIERNAPQWVEVEGAKVCRVPGSRYIAVPHTGRQNSRVWNIVDLDAREFVCQLGKKEAMQWLISAWNRRENAEEYEAIQRACTAAGAAIRRRLAPQYATAERIARAAA